VSNERIRLADPALGDAELAAIDGVLRSGYLTQGPVVAAFERRVADEVGAAFAVATSSCTTALHLALHALGVGPGDDVVVPAFTFPATANAVKQAGAEPRFADVDPATFASSADHLKAAVTVNTRAIMPVDPFGYPAPMSDIVALADEMGHFVIEDAACALGARRDGKACGSYRDVGCFSFHPRKVITTGEGGMITTNDEALAHRLRQLSRHGAEVVDRWPTFTAAGFNYRLSDIHGAIGLAQMDRLDQILALRRRLAGELSAMVQGIDGVRTPVTEPGVEETFQSYVVFLDDSLDRNRVVDDLRAAGVESTLGTYGVHLEPCYARPELADALPGATAAARQTLTLPMHTHLRSADLERIAATLAQAVGDQS
jgi:dTDP-4-amino-4,6-dideoxygalactose transaminase